MPTVGLVGVGLIGRAWANVFSRAGWAVKCWDANSEATANAPKLVADSLKDLARHGLVEDPEGAARRIQPVATLAEAVSGVDLVQESGPETIEAKIQIWKELDAAAADKRGRKVAQIHRRHHHARPARGLRFRVRRAS